MISTPDLIALGLYSCVLIGIGVWGFLKVTSSSDFYLAGGNVPWWLSGVSHHVSGYSAVVFTGYAAIAYHNGVSIYLWWAFSIAVSVFVGSYLIAPRWSRLQTELGMQSPTTYLKTRYGLATQQLIVWTGTLLKLLDLAAKWTAIAIILHGFVGIDVTTGVLIGSGLSLVYIAFGGFWADLANDFFQFLLQVVGGVVMLVAVVNYFEGWGGIWAAWQSLPEGNRALFNPPFDQWYFLAFFLVVFLSYNGGTWNLAMRFMSSGSAKDATKSARLSAFLYLVWPVVLFLPMWLSPAIFPGLSEDQATGVYSMLAQKFIPPGLFGLVLGGLIAATLTMAASDTNAVSAVITQDILPVLFPKTFGDQKTTLRVARITTVIFIFATVVVALNNERFGGVNGLIITWFGALIGPSAIPLLMGLMPVFKKCDQQAAITTMGVGFVAFVAFKLLPVPYSLEVGGPAIASLFTFVLFAFIKRGNECSSEVEHLVATASGKPPVLGTAEMDHQHVK